MSGRALVAALTDLWRERRALTTRPVLVDVGGGARREVTGVRSTAKGTVLTLGPEG